MEWIKIDRDNNGFATDEALDKLYSQLPVVIAETIDDVVYYYTITADNYMDWIADLSLRTRYSHYLPFNEFKSEMI